MVAARVFQRRKTRLNFVLRRDDPLVARDAPLLPRDLGGGGFQIAIVAAQPLVDLRLPLQGAAHLDGCVLNLLERLLSDLQGGFRFLLLAFGFDERCLECGFTLDFALDLLDLHPAHIDLAVDLADHGFRGFFVSLPACQAENVGEDLLAFARRLGREGVGFALLQKCRMDKRLVVEAQQAVDLVLRGAHTRLADVVGRAVAVERDQVECSGAASARAPPDDLIVQPLLLEFEQDVHIVLPHVNQFIVTAGARSAPQRPGDRIEQRRLARAVRPGQAGEMNPVKAQRIGRAVGKKIFDL